MSDLAGKVQTVLGTIDPGEMGVTLPHEHLFADITTLVEAPYEASQRGRAHQLVSLENLGWIRYNYFRNYDNALLTDEGTALSELDLFHRAGGTTIVDVTTVGIGRDPIALARVARASGVNVVMSTGWYVDPTHPPSVAAADEAELTDRMVTEIREGAILERPSAPGHDVTLSMTVLPGAIEASIGPFPGQTVRRELERDDEGVGLRRVLDTTVDRVELSERDGDDWVQLTKRIDS